MMKKTLILFLLLIPNPVMACSLPGNCPPKSDPTPGTPLGVSRRYDETYSYRPEPYPGMLPDNSMSISNCMGKMKQLEMEQTMKDPEFDINNALADYWNHGSDDTAEQEVLLQLPSDQD